MDVLGVILQCQFYILFGGDQSLLWPLSLVKLCTGLTRSVVFGWEIPFDEIASEYTGSFPDTFVRVEGDLKVKVSSPLPV